MHHDSLSDPSTVGVLPEVRPAPGSRRRRSRIGWGAVVGWMVASLVTGCATYGDRVAPIPLPEAQADHVEVAGVKLVAHPYVDRREAKAVFGFDIRGAGLLPVRFVIDNQSRDTVQVVPGQTLLVDVEGNAWPLLSADQAYRRVKGKVEVGETFLGAAKPATLLGAAGAVAGFAVGVITGENLAEATSKGAVLGAAAGAVGGGASRYGELGSQVSNDLARQSLQNRRVGRGELAHGYLFFPGDKEAQSAKTLRLGVKIGATSHIVNLPLGVPGAVR
jgi:hypothetical protein